MEQSWSVVQSRPEPVLRLVDKLILYTDKACVRNEVALRKTVGLADMQHNA
jgi:hypothetical protein